MAARDLRTVRQVCKQYPFFTQSALRNKIFHAEEIGLNRCIVRIGRRVLIDVARFEEWLESQRMAS